MGNCFSNQDSSGKALSCEEPNGALRPNSRTTTMAAIKGDVIYLAADGRVSSCFEHKDSKNFPVLRISSGNKQKIVQIGDRNNMMATISGDELLCEEMLAHISSTVGEDGDLMTAKNAALGYIQNRLNILQSTPTTSKEKKEVEEAKTLEFVFLLCGWLDQKATVYKVGVENGQEVYETFNQSRQTIVTGSGTPWAENFVNEAKNQRGNFDMLTDDEHIEILTQSIVLASLHDTNTGGFVRTCCLRPTTAPRIEIQGHVVNLLRTHFNALRDKLDSAVFMLSEEKYGGQLELKKKSAIRSVGINRGIHENLDEYMVTLGVHRNEESSDQIIHFIRFKPEKFKQGKRVRKGNISELLTFADRRFSNLGTFSAEIPDIIFAENDF